MAMAIERPRGNRWVLWLVVSLAVVGVLALMVEDWGQLWKIGSAADNVPIVMMIPLVVFFTWLGIRQSKDNDLLVERLEEDPPLAKTHHRKTLPWRPGWAREIPRVAVPRPHGVHRGHRRHGHTLRLVNPPQRAARRARQPEPDDEPVEGAVVLPRPSGDARLLRPLDSGRGDAGAARRRADGLPYVDSNPLGNGYYTWKQRRFAISMFMLGFFMWIILIIIGTFIRGPGWIWFWPGQTWDHNAVVFDRNRDLHEIVAGWGMPFLNSYPAKAVFGALVVGLIFVAGGLFFHWLMLRGQFRLKYLTKPGLLKDWATKADPFESKLLARTSILQYLTFQFFAISVLWLFPIKLILRLVFTIKYIWVTPWFNV